MDDSVSRREAAVVLGASGGIGSAVVAALLDDGYHVLGVDAQPAHPDVASHERLLGHVVGDVRDPRATADAFSALEESSLPAVVLVTSMLATRQKPLEELSEGDLHEVMDVLFVSAWRWGRELLARRTGEEPLSVVHVGSVHAFRAAPGAGAYAAAKAALMAVTRAMAVEWGPMGLRCNAVAPGFIPVARNTDLWTDPAELERLTAGLPLRRPATAEDVAQAVLFLASPRSASTTGAVIPVDAGLLSTFGMDV